ncbi:hypothetical protein RJ640_013941 [Escallonia rubra]|uniref:Pentatricopeptide repeat-containing protein n=1 Tax=Escallonia rubra TaxID=112253 RepID=A0AA88QS94_9ASTE|nr:hypothetical protein RJ640_013941 [Escallonia rubra]
MPDVKAYTVMMNGLCQQGLLDEAKELLVKMEENRCIPNDFTYNTIVKGFLKRERYREATTLLDEMLARGFTADATTSEIVVDLLLAKSQDPAQLEMIKRILPTRKDGKENLE